MNIQIKKAEPADMELLMKWRMEVLKAVFSIPAGEDLSQLEAENRAYYENALTGEAHIACFAVSDGEIVGCGGVCLYREMPSPDNQNGICAYLMNIYTRPEWRRRGIGKEIVAWLIRQARKSGITKIYLETSEDGCSLYREMGFTDMRGYMKLETASFTSSETDSEAGG